MSDGLTLAKLQVLIDAQTAPLREELNKVQQQVRKSTNTINSDVGKVDSKMSKLKNSFGKMAVFTATIAIFTKLGKSAIDMASNLKEVQNVVDTAFSNTTYLVENFAKSAIDKFGMSELTAKRTASTYMAMSKSMGLAEEKAAKMSISVAGLTGDVASFYNVSQDVADTALKSIWTGETESLKKFGVVMTQANLQQYAYSQGIQKNVSAMDQAQLTTLRYMYVMNQLSLAQGDFAKTSGSWANQIRILQERWKQLLSIIGNGLIQVLTPVIQTINLVISKIVFFAQVLQSAFSSLFGNSNNPLSGAVESAKGATAAQDDYTASLKASDTQAKKNQKTLASFDEINNLSTTAANDDTSLANSGGFDLDFSNLDLGEPDTSGIERAAEKVKGVLGNLGNWVNEHKSKIFALTAGALAGGTALIKFGGGLKLFLTSIKEWGVISTLKGLLLGVGTPALAAAAAIATVTAAVVYLWNTSDEFRRNIMAVLEGIGGLLNRIWQEILLPLSSFALGLIDSVFIPIANILSQVVCIAIENVAAVLSILWVEILQPIADFIISVLAVALQSLSDVWTAMGPAIEYVIAFLQMLWVDTLQPIVSFITDVLIVAIKIIGTVVKTILSIVQTAFTNFMKFLTDTFIKKWESAWNIAHSVFSSVWNGIVGIAESGINFVIDAVNWCIQQLNKIHIDVPDWVTKLTGMTGFGFSITEISRVTLPRIEVPALAEGGLAFGPTLAMIGDNPSASSDPEVVSPLSKLQNLMGFGATETLNVLMMIYDVMLQIYEKGMDISIDGESLADRVNRISQEKKRRGGEPVLEIDR